MLLSTCQQQQLWVGLQPTAGDHPAPAQKGHLLLGWVVQSPVQRDPEHFQGWGQLGPQLLNR